MNSIFQAHLREVRAHYEANDHALAQRRLIDSVIETHNPAIFRELLQYLDKTEQAGTDTEAAQTGAYALIDKIGQAGVKESAVADKRILTVDNLGKKYAKGFFQLKDLSFSLDASEIVGLVGENGNGKTTLLRSLAGELLPDSGNIQYHFNRGNDLYELKTKLIYIEQRIPRWFGSLMDNLQFTLSTYGMQGEENLLWAEVMIARLGLRPFRKLTWNRISSGYRTRFELAKTLLRQPKILLLDEPLANLDILAQQTILADLKYMASSITAPFGMILSSQHIYEVEKVSDKIIFLKNGVPQYQHAQQQDNVAVANNLIFELETSASREVLQQAFASLALIKLQFNGGVYTATFDPSVESASVLEALSRNRIELIYLRNITHSSRRFFIN